MFELSQRKTNLNGTYDVKYGRQTTSYVVEGHSDVFEAQVVKCDHSHKHDRKRQNLEIG